MYVLIAILVTIAWGENCPWAGRTGHPIVCKAVVKKVGRIGLEMSRKVTFSLAGT